MSTALTRTPVLSTVPGAPPLGAEPGLAADTAEQVSFKTWIAVIGSTVGAFLAILNIQVQPTNRPC
jgi:MFS transporter, DHA2 family, multidrug resistance protein